jgi:RNA polymerase sigma factor (sigma-70 family)
MEQRELVAQARRGNGDSFAALVLPHLVSMLHLAYVVSGSRADAEDIVQESLTKVLRSLGRFDVDRPFRPWFAVIVANQARNWNRSGKRRERLTTRVAALAEVAPASPDDIVVASDERDMILQHVAALESIDREVLAARFLLELSEKEAAAMLSCSIGTVKSRTSRALTRLREQMHLLHEARV